ncbi:MAG: hypothetical protein EZS28_053062, partial [Streblomastix strix]
MPHPFELSDKQQAALKELAKLRSKNEQQTQLKDRSNQVKRSSSGSISNSRILKKMAKEVEDENKISKSQSKKPKQSQQRKSKSQLRSQSKKNTQKIDLNVSQETLLPQSLLSDTLSFEMGNSYIRQEGMVATSALQHTEVSQSQNQLRQLNASTVASMTRLPKYFKPINLLHEERIRREQEVQQEQFEEEERQLKIWSKDQLRQFKQNQSQISVVDTSTQKIKIQYSLPSVMRFGDYQIQDTGS